MRQTGGRLSTAFKDRPCGLRPHFPFIRVTRRRNKDSRLSRSPGNPQKNPALTGLGRLSAAGKPEAAQGPAHRRRRRPELRSGSRPADSPRRGLPRSGRRAARRTRPRLPPPAGPGRRGPRVESAAADAQAPPPSLPSSARPSLSPPAADENKQRPRW